MKPTLANLIKVVSKHGGSVVKDGCGGYDILADREAKRRWIDGEVWCLPLPLSEMEPEEKKEEIQRAIDICSGGTEEF